MLNLRTSLKSVKILLLLYIKLFISTILLFPKIIVFARIKLGISGERQKILFLTSGARRPESKSYKFPWTPGPMPAVNVVKINRI